MINSETLSKLLTEGLALMEPNDPACAELGASVTVNADRQGLTFSVFFWHYGENEKREAHGHGTTPEAALEAFKAKYQPPLTTAGRIAALKAELAKLEGGQS